MAIYFTITGTHCRYGTDFFEPGMQVNLTKETDNEFDSEAIKVELPGMGKVGYVANSTRTRIGDSSSAGRIYGVIGDTAKGTVLYVLENGVVCELVSDTIEELSFERR